MSFTSVTGATLGSESDRVINWIKDSWNEVQTAHEEWGFMRASYLNTGSALGGPGVTFPATSGRAVYPLGSSAGTTCMVAAADFGKWDPFSFRNFTTTVTARSDEIFMDPITYDDWRDSYMYGALRQVTTRPVAVAIS